MRRWSDSGEIAQIKRLLSNKPEYVWLSEAEYAQNARMDKTVNAGEVLYPLLVRHYRG